MPRQASKRDSGIPQLSMAPSSLDQARPGNIRPSTTSPTKGEEAIARADAIIRISKARFSAARNSKASRAGSGSSNSSSPDSVNASFPLHLQQDSRVRLSEARKKLRSESSSDAGSSVPATPPSAAYITSPTSSDSRSGSISSPSQTCAAPPQAGLCDLPETEVPDTDQMSPRSAMQNKMWPARPSIAPPQANSQNNDRNASVAKVVTVTPIDGTDISPPSSRNGSVATPLKSAGNQPSHHSKTTSTSSNKGRLPSAVQTPQTPTPAVSSSSLSPPPRYTREYGGMPPLRRNTTVKEDLPMSRRHTRLPVKPSPVANPGTPQLQRNPPYEASAIPIEREKSEVQPVQELGTWAELKAWLSFVGSCACMGSKDEEDDPSASDDKPSRISEKHQTVQQDATPPQPQSQRRPTVKWQWGSDGSAAAKRSVDEEPQRRPTWRDASRDFGSLAMA